MTTHLHGRSAVAAGRRRLAMVLGLLLALLVVEVETVDRRRMEESAP